MSKYIGAHQWNFLKARDEQYKERVKAEREVRDATEALEQIPSQVPTASNEVLLKLVMDLNDRVEWLEAAGERLLIPTVGKCDA